MLFEADDSEGIRFLLRQPYWTGEAMEHALEKAAARGETELFSFLMEEKRRLFQEKKSRGLSYRMGKYKVNGQMTDQGAERWEEQLAAVGEKILKASRSALYLKMRFLDVALCSLFFVPDPDAEIMGTDGLVLYYCPEGLGRIYQRDPVLVQRLYLMRSCMEFSAI